MNGAVVGSMRYYGAEYGLNYGVSIPTIRSLATKEGKDHLYATYLYQQQVREIRIASLHIAEANKIMESDLDFWARGIINSEIAEEAAFALFQHVDKVEVWLNSENELLVYTALLSIAKSKSLKVTILKQLVTNVIDRNITILTSAIITLLENYCREDKYRPIIEEIVNELPDSAVAKYIATELEWRCEIN